MYQLTTENFYKKEEDKITKDRTSDEKEHSIQIYSFYYNQISSNGFEE